MSFSARVFRILIASPSDVIEEREIAVKTIQEWNDLNSAERQLVLLPLRWETHSAPEYGRRPQEVINRQVVDYCDLLVGIFWTRIGSPTGVADSGTLEEIERVASQGKPVMLYFSQAKQDPNTLDIEQLKKLREFKEKTFPNALVETYSNQIEFRDKVAKQIEIQLRRLLAEESGDEKQYAINRPVTDIRFHFADPETGADIGTDIKMDSKYIDVQDFNEIPDYEPAEAREKTDEAEKSIWSMSSLFPSPQNKNYYRETVTYLVERNLFRPLRFWLKNVGGVGARDVYIDVRVKSEAGQVRLASTSSIRSTPPTKESSTFGSFLQRASSDSEPEPEQRGDTWATYLELNALQPQREVSPLSHLVIGAQNSCKVMVEARIYADTLPEPIFQSLSINLEVAKFSIPAHELVAELRTPIKEPQVDSLGENANRPVQQTH
jgi:hypothetical protein